MARKKIDHSKLAKRNPPPTDENQQGGTDNNHEDGDGQTSNNDGETNDSETDDQAIVTDSNDDTSGSENEKKEKKNPPKPSGKKDKINKSEPASSEDSKGTKRELVSASLYIEDVFLLKKGTKNMSQAICDIVHEYLQSEKGKSIRDRAKKQVEQDMLTASYLFGDK